MNRRIRLLGLALIPSLLVALSGAASAQSPAAADDGWDFDVVAYGWLAGIDGSVATPTGLNVGINRRFSDVLSNLDGALMLYHQGRSGQWGYQLDFFYINLDATAPAGIAPVGVGVKTFMGEVDVTFSPEDLPFLQFLAGARATSVSQSVSLPFLGPVFKADATVVDPILGAQGSWDLGEDWRFRLRGDVGGWGAGSEFTYQMLATFGWEFAEDWALHFGYRLLGYDIQKGGVSLDMQLHGLILGVGFSF